MKLQWNPRNLRLIPALLALGFVWPAQLLPLSAAQSENNQEPPVVDPGPPGGPPSDAIVLFDGKDLSHWKSERGGEAKWKLVDGGAVQVNGTGSIVTKEEFGNVQLHVEWATPSEVKGSSQGRGNSGVYLQGRYEIQVLDSYNNKTYFNGQAGAFYGNFAPLVNASRGPGQWQTYDIIFHAPVPGGEGKDPRPGSFTVLHNGVLVQDHVPVKGAATTAAKFTGVTAKGPLVLQDHGNPVRYRNIWIRPLP
jgi:3-keto-disaccharide hydrolase